MNWNWEPVLWSAFWNAMVALSFTLLLRERWIKIGSQRVEKEYAAREAERVLRQSQAQSEASASVLIDVKVRIFTAMQPQSLDITYTSDVRAPYTEIRDNRLDAETRQDALDTPGVQELLEMVRKNMESGDVFSVSQCVLRGSQITQVVADLVPNFEGRL